MLWVKRMRTGASKSASIGIRQWDLRHSGISDLVPSAHSARFSTRLVSGTFRLVECGGWWETRLSMCGSVWPRHVKSTVTLKRKMDLQEQREGTENQ